MRFIIFYVSLFFVKGEAVNIAKTLDEGYNHVIQIASSEYYEAKNEDKVNKFQTSDFYM